MAGLLTMDPFTVRAFAILLLALAANFVRLLIKNRNKLKGLPKPPHSFVWGNLPVLGKLTTSMPSDCHPHHYPRTLRKEYDLPPVFYLDNWPIANPMCIIADPDAAYQVTQEHSLPKAPSLRVYLDPLIGVNNLVSLEGQEWKKWRGVFNPGFSPGHLMTLVPNMVKDVAIFRNKMKEHADKGDTFSLEELTTLLTVDVISSVVLDTTLNAQISGNKLVTAFRSQARLIPDFRSINPFVIFNPFNRLWQWRNSRIMDDYLGKAIEERFRLRQDAEKSQTKKRSKPIIDIAVDTYQAEVKQDPKQGLDQEFKTVAIDFIKTFIFAGHDTTSSTICYIYYLLAKHPTIHTKLRKELDTVLGPQVDEAGPIIRQNPHILNQLHYTFAVIKETLRLFPPASSIRRGEKGFFVTTPDGGRLPTEGFDIWIISQTIHRRPDLWPCVDEFVPERWLVEEGDPLYPVKGAWRPFEFGPRNCIGQEMTYLEMKLVVAMTVRSFTVEVAFDRVPRGSRNGVFDIEGEQAYQVLLGSAKPADGMPARIWEK